MHTCQRASAMMGAGAGRHPQQELLWASLNTTVLTPLLQRQRKSPEGGRRGWRLPVTGARPRLPLCPRASAACAHRGPSCPSDPLLPPSQPGHVFTGQNVQVQAAFSESHFHQPSSVRQMHGFCMNISDLTSHGRGTQREGDPSGRGTPREGACLTQVRVSTLSAPASGRAPALGPSPLTEVLGAPLS